MLIVLHALIEWHWLESKHIKPYSPWDSPLLQVPITKLVMWSNTLVSKRPKKENKLARMSRFPGSMGTWLLIRLRNFSFPEVSLHVKSLNMWHTLGNLPSEIFSHGVLSQNMIPRQTSAFHYASFLRSAAMHVVQNSRRKYENLCPNPRPNVLCAVIAV